MNRFLSRAEAFTLIGMVLVVFSLFFPWQRIDPGVVLPAVVKISTTRTGFSSPGLYGPLVLCALACGGILLFSPTERNRKALGIAQGACALFCFVISLRYLTPLPPTFGSILGVVGSAFLAYGAIDRAALS